jgi:hypothetical protein
MVKESGHKNNVRESVEQMNEQKRYLPRQFDDDEISSEFGSLPRDL